MNIETIKDTMDKARTARVQYPRGARLETSRVIQPDEWTMFVRVAGAELSALGVAETTSHNTTHAEMAVRAAMPFADGKTRSVWLHVQRTPPFFGHTWYTCDDWFGCEIRREGAALRVYQRVGLSGIGAPMM